MQHLDHGHCAYHLPSLPSAGEMTYSNGTQNRSITTSMVISKSQTIMKILTVDPLVIKPGIFFKIWKSYSFFNGAMMFHGFLHIFFHWFFHFFSMGDFLPSHGQAQSDWVRSSLLPVERSQLVGGGSMLTTDACDSRHVEYEIIWLLKWWYEYDTLLYDMICDMWYNLWYIIMIWATVNI